MKNAIIIVSLLNLVAGTVRAQDSAKDTVYVPEAYGTAAKLFNYSTGQEKPLLNWVGEDPPVECPSGSFWLASKSSVKGCDGGEYELFQLDGGYPAGWQGLRSKPEPPDEGDKTTEPMPHKKDQKNDISP